MKTSKRLILGSVILIAVIIIAMASSGPGTLKELSKGNVFIKGRIERIQRSDNHSFGIYFIRVDTSSINLSGKYKEHILPFYVKGNKAEIYGTIGIDDSVDDVITLNRFTDLITITNQNGKTISQRHASLVEDVNYAFVKANSLLDRK